MHLSIRSFLFCFIISVLCGGAFTEAQTKTYSTNDFLLQNGDLLFQDLDCGEFCDAIEEVTQGINGYELSHIGIVLKQNDSIFVIEAISKGVCITPLDSFLNRSYDLNGKPKVIAGRLKQEFQFLIDPAIKEAISLKGKPYDDVFDINNDAYYCSELVYWAFYHSNNNKLVFELQPMTFKSPKTKETYQIWIDYFNKLDIPIPENEPGINPGVISRSAYLNIFYPYGKPACQKEK